ncbi:unnamed protein product, partial [Urochloa humidicola]
TPPDTGGDPAATDLLPTRRQRISTPSSDTMAASSRHEGCLVTAALKQDASPRARAGRRRAGVARPGHQQAADDVEDSNVAWIDPPGTILPQSMASLSVSWSGGAR